MLDELVEKYWRQGKWETGMGGWGLGCVEHVELFLSLQMFLSVIRFSMLGSQHPLLAHRDYRRGVLSPSMFTFYLFIYF